MRFIKLAGLLLLIAILFTGCIQISFPQNEKPNEKTEENDTHERNTRPSGGSEEETKPKKPVLEERGSVASSQSGSVILRADWEAVSYDGKTADVTVTVYISYSKLYAGKSTGRVTVNGQTQTFSVRAIQRDTTSKVTVTPSPSEFSFAVALSKNGTTDLDMEAVWNVNARIDGDEVSSLVAEEIFPLWTAPDAEMETDFESNKNTDTFERPITSAVTTGYSSNEPLATPTREDESRD